MGNETSGYGDCEFEDEVTLSSNKNVVLQQAVTKLGVPISVLVFDSRSLPKHDVYVDNCAKILKTLKHPNVPTFLAYIKNSDERWVITERVTPLEGVIAELAPEEICAGLFSIIEALSFLHERGGICHNNIRMSSVYVTQDGTWKLGNFEYACKFNEADDLYLDACKAFRLEKSITPEEKAGKVDTKPVQGHCRDAFAFGVLAEEILEYMASSGINTISFERRIREELMNSDPRRRPNLKWLLQDVLFKDHYIEMLNFLKSVTLKSEEEKQHFFSTLAEKLLALSGETVATRLLKLLLSRFVLLDSTACECVMPHLFTPGKIRNSTFVPGEINPILTEPLFRKHLLPEIYKIFHVRDAHIRLVLLRNFPDYVGLFPKPTLIALFPQILLGLRDHDDTLVAMTLHSVAEMVPLLGGDVVIGTHRSKIFSQGLPKFDRKMNGTVQQSDLPLVKAPNAVMNPSREAEKERRKEEAKRRSEERRRIREEQKNSRQKALKTEKLESHNEENQAKQEDGYPADSQLPLQPGGSTEDHHEENPSPCDTNSEETDNEMDRDDLCEIEPTTPMDKFSGSRLEIEPDLGPPVKVDWSGVLMNSQKPSSKPSKGALKLTSKSESGSKTVPNSDSSHGKLTGHQSPDITDDWGTNSEDWGEISKKSPKKTFNKKSPIKRENMIDENSWNVDDQWGDISETEDREELSTPTIKSLDQRNTKPGPANVNKMPEKLGAEFDIMALDIKTAPKAEFDFFADMQPELKPQGDSLLSILGSDVSEITSGKKQREAKNKSKPVSFAMVETSDETAAGWGDDDDWGEMDAMPAS